MKKDILERLSNTVPTNFTLYLVGDAIDEITRLREENAKLRAALNLIAEQAATALVTKETKQ